MSEKNLPPMYFPDEMPHSVGALEQLQERVEKLEAAVRFLASRDHGEGFGIPGLQDMLTGKTAAQQVDAILSPPEPPSVQPDTNQQ